MAGDIESRVRGVLDRTILLSPGRQIGLADDLSSFGLDSVSFIKVIVAIEAEFGLKVDNDDLLAKNFGTIHNIMSYVEKKRNAAQTV